MPYKSNSELPDSVRNVLPDHAQDIYREAFNNAYNEYQDPSDRRGDTDREETPHKVAWSAVKRKYEKGENGRWHQKS